MSNIIICSLPIKHDVCETVALIKLRLTFSTFNDVSKCFVEMFVLGSVTRRLNYTCESMGQHLHYIYEPPVNNIFITKHLWNTYACVKQYPNVFTVVCV